VNGGNGKLVAALYPNPFNPQATLRFTTTKSGFVHVRIYDLHGRVVRDVLDRPELRTVALDVDFRAFQADLQGAFVGYGLELDGKFGNLPYIGRV